MSFVFYLFLVIIGVLFVVFVPLLRNPKRQADPFPAAAALHDFPGSHVIHFPQIRRALAPMDYEFVSQKIPRNALRRMRRERRQVALDYLSALHAEFDRLLRTARVIASLSPEVAAGQELERILLTVKFLSRYRMIRLSLWTGFKPLSQLSNLTNLLSGYSVRLEEAIRALGERAADVAEMVSSPDRRRIHPV